MAALQAWPRPGRGPERAEKDTATTVSVAQSAPENQHGRVGVDRVYPLAEAAAAVRHLLVGHATGKVAFALPAEKRLTSPAARLPSEAR